MFQKKVSGLFSLAFVFSFCVLSSLGGGIVSCQTPSEIYPSNCAADLSHQNVPNGAVILIVDGLGAHYMLPGLKPESLTGEVGTTAKLKNLPPLLNNGFSSAAAVPFPVTDRGHSVIVTGNPRADPEMVGYADSTFLDVLSEEGFICIGIMQRGDFDSMRKKFDVIIYDKSNSINSMDFAIQQNDRTADPQSQMIINEIVSVLEASRQNASSYHSKNTSERYAGYNRWGLDAACGVLSVMEKYPSQKFVLIINVGAVDSTGHYRGYYAYLDSIEQLDRDLEKLIEKCRRNNVFFILTADHGMAFEGLDKKSGGHSSAKYSKSKESTTVPLIIDGPNIRPFFTPSHQEDIAPTLLSLFNIFDSQNLPRFSKGTILPAKETVTLTIMFPQPETIYLYAADSGGECVFSSAPLYPYAYSSYSISGLKPGTYHLKWGVSAVSIYAQTECTIFIEKDTTIDASIYLKKSNPSPFPSPSPAKNLAAESTVSNILFSKTHIFLMIGLINIIGIGIIYKIYKKRR